MRKEQPNADDETGACSICGRRYQNRGHNAQPVNDGRCCDHCNMAVVGANVAATGETDRRR
jgi:hypothetical protein